MPSRAEVILSSSATAQDLPLPLVLPVFQETIGSNLKTSSTVRKPIAGDGANGLEERILNQIGKKNFIEFLLPPKQKAPPTPEGKCYHIQNIQKQIQIQIQTLQTHLESHCTIQTSNLTRDPRLVHTYHITDC
jgi:hypothetical protein